MRNAIRPRPVILPRDSRTNHWTESILETSDPIGNRLNRKSNQAWKRGASLQFFEIPAIIPKTEEHISYGTVSGRNFFEIGSKTRFHLLLRLAVKFGSWSIFFRLLAIEIRAEVFHFRHKGLPFIWLCKNFSNSRNFIIRMLHNLLTVLRRFLYFSLLTSRFRSALWGQSHVVKLKVFK